MPITLAIDASHATARFDAVGPRVHQMLLEELRPIAAEIESDARSRAVEHFHSVGKDPGKYLDSIHGGVSDKGSAVIGWVRSGNPLAHLLEQGFTISDIMIEEDSVMAFEWGALGEVFSHQVHRHATEVRAYPAIGPAFEAKRGEIEAALRKVAESAGG